MPFAAYRVPLHPAPVALGAQPLARLLARRTARIAGGITLAALAVAAFAFAFLRPGRDGPYLLLEAWPIALAVGLVVYALHRAFGPRGANVAALERALYALEVPALVAPAAGAAFALPLTAHLLVVLLHDSSGSATITEVGGFTQWMTTSAVLVGHAHVAVAIHAFLYAHYMHRLPSQKAPRRTAWAESLGLATLCGAIPGALFLFVPPLVVLVTGLPLLPPFYWLLRRTFIVERQRIAAAVSTPQVAL